MDGENTNPFVLVLRLIIGIEAIVAFLGNGFIMVVNGHRWLQTRKMLPSDLLLTTLGTTRFLLQLVIVMSRLLYIHFHEYFYQSYLWICCFYAWTYLSSASVWCATWLSVFYCVKITNFAHSLFLWLKPRIDWLVPRMLRWSLTVFSVPFVASAFRVKMHCNTMGNMSGNTSQGEDCSNYQYQIFISLQFTFIAINVSICLTAFILLLISLWRHTRNLKRSGFATKDFNTQAHINVVYSLLSFLFFYVQYLVALIVFLSNSTRPSIVDVLISEVALSLCPSAHSIILILTNPKLKNICIQILKIRQRTS